MDQGDLANNYKLNVIYEKYKAQNLTNFLKAMIKPWGISVLCPNVFAKLQSI
jgi:hypothetical protein